MSHPNAVAGGGGYALAAVIVYLADLFGLAVPLPIALVAAGAAGTLVLLIGRKGLKGIARTVWGGAALLVLAAVGAGWSWDGGAGP